MSSKKIEKNAFYFSHDSNARNDPKILKLRRELKLDGYAIYFMLIEVLREQTDHKFPIEQIPDLAYDFRVKEDLVNRVINDFNLFQTEEGFFYSDRLCRSMDQWVGIKERRSEAGKRGNETRWGNKDDNQKRMVL